MSYAYTELPSKSPVGKTVSSNLLSIQQNSTFQLMTEGCPYDLRHWGKGLLKNTPNKIVQTEVSVLENNDNMWHVFQQVLHNSLPYRDVSSLATV